MTAAHCITDLKYQDCSPRAARLGREGLSVNVASGLADLADRDELTRQVGKVRETGPTRRDILKLTNVTNSRKKVCNV